ncbi:UNVERIFIED_CONTAM: putative RDD family membrane protein YckC [Acetivibrio alkalicellulosi]
MQVSKLSQRFLAYFFDIVIVTGVYGGGLILLSLLGKDIPIQGVFQRNLNDLALFCLTFGVFYLLYEIVFLTSSLSATPGKLIFNLEIISCKKSSVVDSLIRSFIKVLATMTQIIPIFFFFVAVFRVNNQTVHDIASDTIVVKKQISHSVQPTGINLFEEMKRRGLKTYSEQVALANELKNMKRKTVSSASSYSWLGVVIFLFSVICGFAFFSLFYSDFNQIRQSFNVVGVLINKMVWL